MWISRYFENWQITLYHVVDILTLHGPIRDSYSLEFSEEVRSKFRVIGGVDSSAPSSGRARSRRPARNSMYCYGSVFGGKMDDEIRIIISECVCLSLV